MRYEKKAIEKDILAYWLKKKSFDILRTRNNGKKKFSFLDGPITANNPMGVHHAWGRTLKDVFQRYHALKLEDQRYQNGFDCQGLWLEVETEKELGFNSKQDIESFGLDTFSNACRSRVEKYSVVQTEQSQVLGQWMDWEHSYYTMSDENIESIWYFLKKCHEERWLYKGKRILPWCIRCGTSSSKHEMADEGYATLKHDSVFVRVPLLDREGYLLLWTTTEWTLSSNVSAAVNPRLDYVKVKNQGALYYLVRAALKHLKGDYEILEELKGAELVGLKYQSLYPDLDVQKNIDHAVIAWDEVGEETGTGIVHIAPSCGEEDFDLGMEKGLPLLACALDEVGNYVKGFGRWEGKNVQNIKKDIVHDLEKRGLLYKTDLYEHRYPVCWRCKSELVFRLDSSWFIACDSLRPRMKAAADTVHWHPAHVGKLMQDWLDNMGDWNISRRRYWGLPLMFYECSCGQLTVIGSKKELREKAVDPKKVDSLSELHRPWIDKIHIRCSCGKSVQRIPEVGDCWLDAGIVPFSTMHYFDDKQEWKKWFPVDLVIEMRAQVRLWFYALLFMSVVLEGVAPYKNVLAYEEVRDEKGEPMHKSRGNAIWFDDAAEKMGVDVMRWQYCSQNPMYNLNFGYGPAQEIERYLTIIWNLGLYVQQNCSSIGKEYAKDPVSLWLLSRRAHVARDTSSYLDQLDYHKALDLVKSYLLDDLSRGYGQYMRDEVSDSSVQNVFFSCFKTGLQLLSPFLPFFSEKLYLDVYNNKESIFLEEWPSFSEKDIDSSLETSFSLVQDVLQSLLAAREKAQVGVRWPLKKVSVFCYSKDVSDAVLFFKDLILRQINVKDLSVVIVDESIDEDLLCSFKQGYVELDTSSDPTLEREGFSREVSRRIQSLRRKAGLQKEDSIHLFIDSSYSLEQVKNDLTEKVGAAKIYFADCSSCEHQDHFKIKDSVFKIGFHKV